MCSFLVTNKKIDNITEINKILQLRGPDYTKVIEHCGFFFIHNLLSLTGQFTIQPIINNNILCLFNGQIYNYKDFGNITSDGYSIVEAYKKYGFLFPKYLDGEFAIILFDFELNILILSTDVFATKPLWADISSESIGISTYVSPLELLSFKNIVKIPANKVLIYSLSDFKLIYQNTHTEFDLSQYKNYYDDWIYAFKNSIHKRITQSQNNKLFIGLSSGYDSGAIANEMSLQNADFKAYTILANEDINIINKRHQKLKNSKIIRLTKSEYEYYFNKINEVCENYCHDYRNYTIKNDKASIGLAYICDLALKEGRKIYMSGQGADEIISDYGYKGVKFYEHSQFGGLFPDKLETIFPWNSFYSGTQIMYLLKEEYVAGMFGIEARYPFLDKQLVQEFLNLSSILKNSKYKSVIAEYNLRHDYPYIENKKIGFQADQNLQS